MSEESKTVVGLLNKVASDMCDNYRKWPEKCGEDNEKELYEEHCEKCPLGKLGL